MDGDPRTPLVELECVAAVLQNTPLHPVAEWGRLRFGGDLPAEQRLADLENTLQLVGLDAAEYALLIAPLVDIPLPEDRAAKFAPEELRRRQLAAIVTWFLAGARFPSRLAQLAFEDSALGLDPTSLDLMQALARARVRRLILILADYGANSESPPCAVERLRSAPQLHLAQPPFDRADVALLVGALAARHPLSRAVVEGVSERTGGVPRFVEEVTRPPGVRARRSRRRAGDPADACSSRSRRGLDRLGEARDVAQIGCAVLWTRFHLCAVARCRRARNGRPGPPVVIRTGSAGADLLLFIDGAGPPGANYRFAKHALIQDAAYESLLKSRRQALHRRAAEILRDDPERAAAEPEVIAHHFTESGLDDPAIEWWGKAGDQALRRSAFQEAISHLGKALAMADKAGATGRKAPDSSAAPVSEDANARRFRQRADRGAWLWGARKRPTHL